MGWKEFLKPDWKKLLLLFVFIFIKFFISNNFGILLEYIISPFFSFLYTRVLEPLVVFKWFYLNLFLYAFLYTLDGVYWYILSCLIVWVYNKFRKKEIIDSDSRPVSTQPSI